MGGAILEGLLAPHVSRSGPVQVTTRTEARKDEYHAKEGVIARASEVDSQANKKAVAEANVVILGVKPAGIHDLIQEIASELKPGTVLISVAAGVTIASMAELVPTGVSVVRAMPNTPALVGKGITGITAGPETTPDALEVARKIFITVGEVLLVDSEEKLDALSAVSGSGPAYVFMFIEKMTAAAARLGFSPEEASLLVEGTFSGATALLQAQTESPSALRQKVTSPGGTTEQALKKFDQANLDQVFDEALQAAISHAKELATTTVSV